jgi:hypothetical protein
MNWIGFGSKASDGGFEAVDLGYTIKGKNK